MNKKIKSIQSSENKDFVIMFLPAFIILVILGIVPVISIFGTSMLSWEIVNLDKIDFVFLENFVTMFKDERFLNSIGIQFIMSFVSVTVQVLVGLLFALVFNRSTGFVKALRGVIVLPYVMPPVVVALIWLTLFTPAISPLNAIMTSMGLPSPNWLTVDWLAMVSLIIADAWNSFPFCAIIILSALQNVPLELYESAEVDGANLWQETTKITIPSISWSLVSCAILRIIESFKAFPLIFIMTGGGPGTSTQVTNFYAYLSAFQYGHLGYASAMSFTMFLVTALLSLIILRSNRTALYR